MNLDFSPEQKQFREQLRRFLQKSDGLSQARSILDGKVQNYSAPIWKGLAEMSVQAIAIPEEHSGVERQPVKTIDPTRPAARLTFAGAAVERLADSGGGAWKTLTNRAAVFLAFEQLGSAETALAMACAYAQERTAFGRKIGSFQAIKHKLADMYTKIQLARCHCYYGAWAISTDAPEVP